MAELAGLPVVYGPYGTFLPLAVYGLLGTSRQHVIGPDSTRCIDCGDGGSNGNGRRPSRPGPICIACRGARVGRRPLPLEPPSPQSMQRVESGPRSEEHT